MAFLCKLLDRWAYHRGCLTAARANNIVLSEPVIQDMAEEDWELHARRLQETVARMYRHQRKAFYDGAAHELSAVAGRHGVKTQLTPVYPKL